jgi:hypothetical protein
MLAAGGRGEMVGGRAEDKMGEAAAIEADGAGAVIGAELEGSLERRMSAVVLLF